MTTCLITTFISSLMLALPPIKCDVISGTYGITMVTQSDYGNPLESFYISGITKCFAECQKDTTCQSVVYNKATLLCQTNRIAVLPSTLLTSSDPTVQQYYYTGKVEQTLSTIRQSCTMNSHCLDVRSECRDHICKCYYGYSHDSSIHTCVTSCPAYGPTFQEEVGRYIGGYNAEIVDHTTDIYCKALCLQATTFTCKTYEFDYSTKSCYLQSVTHLMIASDIDSNYNLYTRDCA